jgi:hypothetical protein
MQLGDASPWTFPALASSLDNGFVMLEAFVPYKQTEAFVDELTTEPNVKFVYNERQVANLALSDSAAAARSMVTCQKTMNAEYGKPTDPFAAADPFQPN